MKVVFSGFYLLILTSTFLHAQLYNYSDKQELLLTQINNLTQLHDSIFNSKDFLINGKSYYSIESNFNHPFFIDNTWRPGKIWSSDNIFNADMIKYDINSDYLVYLIYRNLSWYPIYLNKEPVIKFMISGHYFQYLQDFEKSFIKNQHTTGYYEVLYDGVTKFYVRWGKSINNSKDQSYTQWILFFVKKEGKYYQVSGNRSLVDALNDHKNEIKTFMKKNNIHFSINKFDSIIKVFEYYDKL